MRNNHKKHLKRWLLSSALLAILLVLTVIAEKFVDLDTEELSEIPYFYAWFGFGSCIIIVVAAKLLGIFVKRNEDYYKGD
jgi:hypothetical protein